MPSDAVSIKLDGVELGECVVPDQAHVFIECKALTDLGTFHRRV